MSSHLRPPVADPDVARQLVERTDFVWHQRFELAPDVFTPGVSDVQFLYEVSGVPEDLTGMSVLDIGTTNGAAVFEAERRGASRCVAVDIYPPTAFGFTTLAEAVGSSAEFVRSSVYDLPVRLDGEQFDVVFFWGVLYHLRHPLLALDAVRAVARDRVYVESAVSDSELPPRARKRSVSLFYRRDELGDDASNWFSPTTELLQQWLGSCGLEPVSVHGWPEEAPRRAGGECRVTAPEWAEMSYEYPVDVRVELP
jgi:tRNA (mo5U34)-methyltransferase